MSHIRSNIFDAMPKEVGARHALPDAANAMCRNVGLGDHELFKITSSMFDVLLMFTRVGALRLGKPPQNGVGFNLGPYCK